MASYRINLTPDDNGTVLVTSPTFPEVTSFGEDEADAKVRGLAAIEEAIAARISAAQNVPFDGATNHHAGTTLFVETPLLVDLKVDLYQACRAANVTRAELARRLGWNRNSVDRLFQIDHGSRLEQIEAAAKAINLRVEGRLVQTAESVKARRFQSA